MAYPNLLSAMRDHCVTARNISQATGMSIDEVCGVFLNERILTNEDCRRIHKAFFKTYDFDHLFDTNAKQPEPVVEELEQVVLPKEAVICAAKHLIAFYDQDKYECKADFTESCTICNYSDICQSRNNEPMNLIFELSGIRPKRCFIDFENCSST